VACLNTLTIPDIPQVLELSGAEGWNQTGKDWKLMIENPGNICLALKKDGKIVATATAMNYENQVAWIGMVLVEKSHRGKGYSKLLLAEILNRLKSCKTVKLDATPAGQPVYQKFGFQNERIINRMVLESPSMDLPDFENGNLPTRIHSAEIPEIIKYDAEVFGARRNLLVKYLIHESPENSWMLTQQSQLKGIALGRKGSRFFQVGPVSADSEEVAKMLIIQALKKFPLQLLIIDVLEDKTQLITWLNKFGFKKQRQFVRMFLGENSNPGTPENQFSICGPEFG
jgi:predicted GNAT family acetyltransferase